jgi:hypothetical protein
VGHVGDITLPYLDEDNTGEFHVSVTNDQATAIAAGDMRLEFSYRPDFQI